MRRRNSRGIAGRSANLVEDPINPLDGVANLADIMLVLAAGIMLALVINWKIDLTGLVSRMDAVETSGDTEVNQNRMQEMDLQVYQDSETGRYYVVDPAAQLQVEAE
jgi:hypothetical protein